MKPTIMKSPGLIDLYQQRVSHDAHRKKLQKIRQQRKSHLGYDESRFNLIQSLKQSKNRSFINKFNRTNQVINKQNIAFLGKLKRARPFSRYSQNESKQKKVNQSYNFMNPYMKKKVNEAQQQNLRICSRMRSLSSSLNAQKMDKDYQRSQQIKNRLQRYISNENKVTLKIRSQKYLEIKKPYNSSRQSDIQNHSFNQKPQKKTTASHYNAQQITKNKVHSGNNLLKIRKRYNSRPNTTHENVQQFQQKNKQQSFFTTQPTKVNASSKIKRRNVYI